MKTQLTHMVSWAHRLLAEVLQPGDLAVDLTSGNGHDTLFLWRQVGVTGTVLSFDLQPRALTASAQRLRAEGAVVACGEGGDAATAGVRFILADHAQVNDYLIAAPQAAIANLGFLPGGDQTLVTRPQSTLAALRALCARLVGGGRIAVVAYIGHPGGREEGELVERFCAELPPEQWRTIKLTTLNRRDAPWLMVLEKH
ncbi:MAG: rRNA methyltransferase [Desulfuromonadaceae bacterium]|nr:rRNA methyltransferase [Desulfuromonadaceae bacterium]